MRVSLHRAERSALAEARDRAVDQLRADRAQRGAVQPVLRHHAGREVLDHDIGAAHQVEHQLAGARVGQIDRDAALAGVHAREVGALVGAIGQQLHAGIAHFVAFARTLDLDDGGAEVGEQPGAVGACQHAGEVEDGEASEQRLVRMRGLGHGRGGLRAGARWRDACARADRVSGRLAQGVWAAGSPDARNDPRRACSRRLSVPARV